MNIISLFSGCGGFDKGFQNAGFNILWANDNNRTIEETYRFNHPDTHLIIEDIKKIPSIDIPDNPIGLIGVPPCQSWSAAGNGLGIEDSRGTLFYEYIRVLEDKQPLFFVAENVKGMLSRRHRNSFDKIVELLQNAGYTPSIQLVNAADYGVPQNRERVIIVGYRNDLNLEFEFPEKNIIRPVVRDFLSDIIIEPVSSINNLSQPALRSVPRLFEAFFLSLRKCL